MQTTPLSKLRFRCRRGMLELDIILERFLDNGYGETSDKEKQQFDELLQLQDPELNLLITGATPAPSELVTLLNKIIPIKTNIK